MSIIIERYCVKLLLISLLLALISGCAPKQVRIYQPLDSIRNDIVQYAIALLGKPYRNGAKGSDAFDCSGLVYYIYKKVNIVLPVATEGLVKAGYDLSRENVLPGDLVFFKIKKSLHSGIMINKADFIHSSISKGVTVDNLESTYWRKSFFCFRSVLQ
jgi:cell wall-associated NlpC family hydrolase